MNNNFYGETLNFKSLDLKRVWAIASNATCASPKKWLEEIKDLCLQDPSSLDSIDTLRNEGWSFLKLNVASVYSISGVSWSYRSPRMGEFSTTDFILDNGKIWNKEGLLRQENFQTFHRSSIGNEVVKKVESSIVEHLKLHALEKYKESYPSLPSKVELEKAYKDSFDSLLQKALLEESYEEFMKSEIPS